MNLEDEPEVVRPDCVVVDSRFWAPTLDHLIIQDADPASILNGMRSRLLAQSLKASWPGPGDGWQFRVWANVRLFYEARQTPLVPAVMVSLDTDAPTLFAQGVDSYVVWEFGKPPNVVIEFVSDESAGEAEHKMRQYARIAVCYYVIFDPFNRLKQGVLRAYELRGGVYEPIDPRWLPNVGLGLTLWEGEYEGYRNTWLRWCDRDGAILLDGAERAEQERLRAEEANRRAEEERQRAERLAAQLRAMGINPDA